MHFFYSDTEKSASTLSPAAIHKLNPNFQFAKHADNWFFLKLVLLNGTIVEKHQASKELAICDRKLEFWSKKRNFDDLEAELEISRLKKKWQQTEGPSLVKK